jgi:hypothetical protein
MSQKVLTQIKQRRFKPRELLKVVTFKGILFERNY